MYIFFDGDKTGKRASEKIARELVHIKEKLRVRIVNTPEDEDVNSLLVGHEPEIFTHLLDSSLHFSLTESSAPVDNNEE